MVAGVQFFLGIDEKLQEEAEAEKEREVAPSMVHAHSKKTRARNRYVAKVVKKNKKALSKKEENAAMMFPALQLLNDPQV